VAYDELRLLHLLQDVELQSRVDVAEEDERRLAEVLWNLRREVREHAKMRLERLRHVEVVTIAAAPAERATLRVLDAGEVDRPILERAGQLVERVIVAHDADDLHRRVMRCAG